MKHGNTIFGLKTETVNNMRELYSFQGWTANRFAVANEKLKSIYEANKATANRPVNYFDNVYGWNQ